jgi:ferredoxin
MRLLVDPIACEAHGLCAELLPEVVELDDWGYPVIADGDLAPPLEGLARRAVSACPTLALRLKASARAAAQLPGSARPGSVSRENARSVRPR